jgi:DNA-binding NarL/FixJ family response regulator
LATTRILLVDDNKEFLEEASRFVASLEGVEVSGTALSGEEALALLDQVRADLVLMDLVMPGGMNGLEATRCILERPAAPAVVVMSIHDDETSRAAALEAGALAFVAKGELVTDLPAIERRLAVAAATGGASGRR